MAQTRLTVKNYKVAEWASEETECFTASLYLDGKRIGTARNDGHGGPDYYDFLTPAGEKAFWDYVKEWKESDEVRNDPKHQVNGEFFACEESLVAEACRTFRREKEMKRAMKVKGTQFAKVIRIERPVSDWETEIFTISLHEHHDPGLILAEKVQENDVAYVYEPRTGVTEAPVPLAAP